MLRCEVSVGGVLTSRDLMTIVIGTTWLCSLCDNDAARYSGEFEAVESVWESGMIKLVVVAESRWLWSVGVAAVTGNVFIVSPYSSEASVEIGDCFVGTTGTLAGPAGVVELKWVSVDNDSGSEPSMPYGCWGGLVAMAVVANVTVSIVEMINDVCGRLSGGMCWLIGTSVIEVGADDWCSCYCCCLGCSGGFCYW